MHRSDGLDALVGRARDLRALLDQVSVICSERVSASYDQPHTERTRVETARWRALTLKTDVIRSYDERHGLRRAPEVGRRVDGRSRIGRGRRGAASITRDTMVGKGLILHVSSATTEECTYGSDVQ